jgi:hypothetical protein
MAAVEALVAARLMAAALPVAEATAADRTVADRTAELAAVKAAILDEAQASADAEDTGPEMDPTPAGVLPRRVPGSRIVTAVRATLLPVFIRSLPAAARARVPKRDRKADLAETPARDQAMKRWLPTTRRLPTVSGTPLELSTQPQEHAVQNQAVRERQPHPHSATELAFILRALPAMLASTTASDIAAAIGVVAVGDGAAVVGADGALAGDGVGGSVGDGVRSGRGRLTAIIRGGDTISIRLIFTRIRRSS